MSAPSTSSEDDWCAARSADVAECLQRTQVEHGRIGEWPAWHVMPYASIWAIESKERPEFIGWWAIAGDLPTDLLPAHDLATPRDAMRAFGKRWTLHGASLDRGDIPAAWQHVAVEALPKLAAQLKKRGAALLTWADDDSSWPPLDAEED
jgi:Domain of unknown function (DUF4826)